MNPKKTFHYYYRFLLLGLITLINSSCVTRYLTPQQAIVRKIDYVGFKPGWSTRAENFVVSSQKPNSFIDLQLYWLLNKKGRKNIGQPPAILDSNLIEVSRIEIKRFLQSKGYLDAEVASNIQIKKQKAKITFTAKQNVPYHIATISYQVADSTLLRLSQQHKSLVKIGELYDAETLALERDRIYESIHTDGYFYFNRQYITFEIDSHKVSHHVDIKITINNQLNGIPHKRYQFGNTYLAIKQELSPSKKKSDTIVFKNQYYFIDETNTFKSKNFFYYLYHQKGDWYYTPRERITLNRISELNQFKRIDLKFDVSPKDSTQLDMYLQMIPRKRMSNKISGDFNFNTNVRGFNIGNTFSNINTFGGGELLSISLKAGLLSNNDLSGSGANAQLVNQNYQVGVDLTIPRLLSIIRFSNLLGQYGVPKTTLSSGFQFYEQQDAIKRNVFVNALSYTWKETEQKYHKLTPINIEFVEGKLAHSLDSILTARGNFAYLYTVNRTIFTLGSQYLYTYNAIKLNTFENFAFFQGNIDVAGHSLQLYDLLFKLKRTSDGLKTVFDTPFSQYIKVEFDWRKYLHFGNERQLIFRLSSGVGVPLGNSNALTFEKYFFAGGFNSNRAWLARSLGPGNFNRSSIQDVQVNDVTKNLGQFGEVKLEGNIEYRFKIIALGYAKLKGATFVDFGNIFRLKQEVETPNGQLDLNHIGQQIAVGAGIGLRLDLNFFVFRVDLGLKIKDPQFQGNEQWVIRHFTLGSNNFTDAYEKTNAQSYRFWQFNFGIGLPF